MDVKWIGYLIDAVLIGGVTVAVYCDVRWGKIYNKITFPCMAAGVLLNDDGVVDPPTKNRRACEPSPVR